MKYRTVKKNGDKLSILGYGCMRLPQQGRNIDKERAKKQIYSAIDRGVNYLDTAYPYHAGQSEPFLGEIITPEIRKNIKLATKLPPASVQSKADMQKILDNQLKKLKTDYIDYYLLHGVDENNWKKFMEFDILDFLDKQVAAGKIINPGFSFHGRSDLFNEVVDAYPWVFCQIQYNYLDEHFQAGTKGLKYAASKDLAVFVMEPLRGGTLTANVPSEIKRIFDSSQTKRTLAEWAFTWLYNQDEVTMVLSGMNEEKHIDENIYIAENATPNCLSQTELDIIKQAEKKYHKLLEVPCTACGYCMPCPMNVDIPGNFDLYNRVTFYKDSLFHMRFVYMLHNNGLGKGKTNYASKCIGCGKCVKKCPQSINIPEKLKLVEKKFEGATLKVFESVGKMLYKRAK